LFTEETLAKKKEKQKEGEIREPADLEEVIEAVEVEVLEPEEEPDTVSDEPEAVEAIEADIAEPTEETLEQEPTLEQLLQEAQAQAQEYLNDLQRERAAFQNYKKRQENERAKMYQVAQSNLLLQILPVLDDFERALENIPEQAAEQEWLQGISLIQRQLQGVLQAAGVLSIEAEPGQDFDPFFHEAVTYEENDEYQQSQIIAQVQQGYQLGERVLRPSMVRVAK
jgi:molecular chaperone GrpE